MQIIFIVLAALIVALITYSVIHRIIRYKAEIRRRWDTFHIGEIFEDEQEENEDD